MKRWIDSLAFVCMLGTYACAQGLFPGLGSQRVGISSFTFLKIAADPRGSSMGESFVAIADDASALYWNPAGIVRLGFSEVQFSQTSWFADVDHRFIGLVIPLNAANAVGVSILSLSTDPIEITSAIQPTGTGQSYRYADLGMGITYARQMTDQFSFGVTARYLHESIAELTMQSFVLDLGAYYAIGFNSARFAFVISHFGPTARPRGTAHSVEVGTITEFEEFSPPTIFRMGFAFEPIVIEGQRITTTVQLNHPNDNAEHIGLGIEYSWQETVFLRGGYRFNVEEVTTPAFGIGLRIPVNELKIRADYAATVYSFLGTVHRIGLSLSVQ